MTAVIARWTRENKFDAEVKDLAEEAGFTQRHIQRLLHDDKIIKELWNACTARRDRSDPDAKNGRRQFDEIEKARRAEKARDAGRRKRT